MTHRLAVVGLGRAGRARVREIETSPRATLAGVVSQHDPSATHTFDELLADPAVEAVIVCTVNATHGRLVRAALEATKHVAVEFPLCLDADEAAELFALADDRARVLHVEHIELLTGRQAELRERVPTLGAIRRGELRFQGGADGWIVDPDRAGFPSFTGIARLHVLWDLVGPLRARAARLEPGTPGFRFEAELTTRDEATLSWSEERRPGLSRETRLRFEGERGILTTEDLEVARSTAGGPSLFGRDLETFLDRIEGAPESPGERARILGALKVAADCHTLARTNPASS